ncbi:hypothetical protein [Microbacterium sp. Leaf320]|uniref:hypothetical protein n=1 Tax=Microbacterium sp. Leaf320 TaxID=1736334 RepID=UPI0006F39E46|nr:hypothetical protein [Microbacterium sp. Leaf320]KQQ62729.1 hypothetical protein ASF63_18430 [Microbacterium sp. Leaf320]
MDQNTGRTPHAEEPAEGSPAQNPEHNTAPDGQSTAGARREPDELDGNAQGSAQGGAIQGDSSHGDAARGAIQGEAEDGNAQGAAQGGAIQGDSSHGESPRGAIQGDASPDRDAALGGDKHTEDQLTADNEVEEDALRSLDPNDAPA